MRRQRNEGLPHVLREEHVASAGPDNGEGPSSHGAGDVSAHQPGWRQLHWGQLHRARRAPVRLQQACRVHPRSWRRQRHDRPPFWDRPVRVCDPGKDNCHDPVDGEGSQVDSARDIIQEVYAGEAKGLKWAEVVFTELLDNKTPKAVARAVGRIHAQLTEMGFPLARIHGDAGREFTEPPLRNYAAERGILFSHAR